MTLPHTPFQQPIVCALYLACVSVGLLWLGRKADSDNALRKRIQYQLIIALITGIIFACGYYVKLPFAHWGNLTVAARPNPILGITSRDSWLDLWFSLGLIVAVTTAVFMGFNRAKTKHVTLKGLFRLLPLIILLSATNAFAEEVFYRLAPIWILSGFAPVVAVCASALAFGIVHYWGVPQGFIGAIMAAFLSYISSLSIFETGGILWAWGLHFVLDFIILSQLIPHEVHSALQKV